MDPIVWVVIVIAVLVVIAAVVLLTRQRSRAQLRERFGPEYERRVEETGSRREAESELAAVADRRDSLDIRELDPATRQRRLEEWAAVQTRFVDEPAEAVAAASDLVTGVMRERGYPVEDFEERTSLVAADHPDVVQHYRDAHTSLEAHRASGQGDTEDLRRAFVHFRKLFDALTRRDGEESTTVPPGTDERLDDGVPAPRADHDPTRPVAGRDAGRPGEPTHVVLPDAGTTGSNGTADRDGVHR